MIHAQDLPTFSDIHPALMRELQGCVVVAHNARFDSKMITQSCDGVLAPPMQPWLCSLGLSQRLLNLQSCVAACSFPRQTCVAVVKNAQVFNVSLFDRCDRYTLAQVCNHYGIVLDCAHRAGGDVKALAKVGCCVILARKEVLSRYCLAQDSQCVIPFFLSPFNLNLTFAVTSLLHPQQHLSFFAPFVSAQLHPCRFYRCCWLMRIVCMVFKRGVTSKNSCKFPPKNIKQRLLPQCWLGVVAQWQLLQLLLLLLLLLLHHESL